MLKQALFAAAGRAQAGRGCPAPLCAGLYPARRAGAHGVCLLFRELEPPRRRGVGPDVAAGHGPGP